jgi:hypothetical protein
LEYGSGTDDLFNDHSNIFFGIFTLINQSKYPISSPEQMIYNHRLDGMQLASSAVFFSQLLTR